MRETRSRDMRERLSAVLLVRVRWYARVISTAPVLALPPLLLLQLLLLLLPQRAGPLSTRRGSSRIEAGQEQGRGHGQEQGQGQGQEQGRERKEVQRQG